MFVVLVIAATMALSTYCIITVQRSLPLLRRWLVPKTSQWQRQSGGWMLMPTFKSNKYGPMAVYLLLQMFQTGGRALAWHQGADGPPVNPTIMAGELASGQHDTTGEGKSGTMIEGGPDHPSWGWKCGPWVLTTTWGPSPTAFEAGRVHHHRCHHCHYSHLLRIQIPSHWVHPNG